jgi:hypothetical protein
VTLVPTPGRGGVSRGGGPGGALYGEEHQGSDAFQSQKLPPGRAPSRDWRVTGVTRSAPTVDPQRPGEAGGAGAAGSGAPTGQRRVLPQHRDVVRTFFGGTPPTGK